MPLTADAYSFAVSHREGALESAECDWHCICSLWDMYIQCLHRGTGNQKEDLVGLLREMQINADVIYGVFESFEDNAA